VLVIKNEGRIKTTFMTWGFISPWAKDPFDKKRPRPFNARSETVEEKRLFFNDTCVIQRIFYSKIYQYYLIPRALELLWKNLST